MKLKALSLMSLVGSTSAFAPVSTRTHGQQFALEATRRPFISGNWKLNPQTKEEAVKLASEIAESITSSSPDVEVALFVPFVFLEAAMDAVNGKLRVGAEVSNKKEIDFKR
jgi:triosephosphate isomerase (TIM)